MANGIDPPPELDGLRKIWSDRVDHVRARGSILPLDTDIQDIVGSDVPKAVTDGLEKVKRRLSGDPILNSNPWSLKLVGIEGLISIQKQVNVTSAESIASAVVDGEDIVGATKLALLTELPPSPITLLQDSQGIIVSSPNMN